MNDLTFAPEFIVKKRHQPEFKAPRIPGPSDIGHFRSVPYVCEKCRRDAKDSFAAKEPFCECFSYHWSPLDKYESCPTCKTWWMECGCPLPKG